MKKAVLFISFMVLCIGAIFAQEVEPPGDYLEVLDNFPVWFGTLAGIAALGVFLAGVVNGLFKITGKVGKQIVAWIICVALAFIGNLINLGFLSEATWVITLIYGLGAGLVANGIFDVALVKAFILAIESQLNKNK